MTALKTALGNARKSGQRIFYTVIHSLIHVRSHARWQARRTPSSCSQSDDRARFGLEASGYRQTAWLCRLSPERSVPMGAQAHQ